jgi:hypothetical protein
VRLAESKRLKKRYVAILVSAHLLVAAGREATSSDEIVEWRAAQRHQGFICGTPTQVFGDGNDAACLGFIHGHECAGGEVAHVGDNARVRSLANSN